MGVRHAHNRSIIPSSHALQEAHQTGVRNERPDVRFVDSTVVSHSFLPALASHGYSKMSRSVSEVSTAPRSFLPKWIEVKPVVRRKTRIVLQAFGVTLHPTLNVLSAVLAI